ncbi:hypothetical protein [Methylobacterium gnaphalii]|uniref:Lysozyme inhibitor LprI N-terminal domain-containing protein n=1 Tax=Methylobacterium gnaphalii TaxID=1010610 RepID=A0A512JHP1_9HYPH|nr:hypothetical protein [Methylobacterium gnaphalii]GEP09479.1 hypothetical protein MGN01_13240 [Methylobacterium gnaphalii]GJD68042.1 hypothetical protein MMMDOFMJ_0960 [Methylobacterium gnaphalii]GLS51594.1 hypothetical protein GCM10007885_44520 [Methylobacterium gnaphalii]
MRGSRLSAPLAALVAAGWLAGAPAWAQEQAELDRLRGDWHRCVRQHFSGQPLSIERRAAERAALAACKAQEDAYVAAELTARTVAADSTPKRGLTTRALAWISSAAASVVDPVASWFGR